jgi:aminoglycoside phosphotransferase (APT) family kinase protein
MRRHVDELVVRLPRIRVATGQIDRVDDPVGFALDLADVVRRLQTVRTDGAPAARNRARPLVEYHEPTRRAIESARDLIDAEAAVAVWEAALAAPADVGPHVWAQGDLEGNCLVRDGQLTGIVDWGSACAGTPQSTLSLGVSTSPRGRGCVTDPT